MQANGQAGPGAVVTELCAGVASAVVDAREARLRLGASAPQQRTSRDGGVVASPESHRRVKSTSRTKRGRGHLPAGCAHQARQSVPEAGSSMPYPITAVTWPPTRAPVRKVVANDPEHVRQVAGRPMDTGVRRSRYREHSLALMGSLPPATHCHARGRRVDRHAGGGTRTPPAAVRLGESQRRAGRIQRRRRIANAVGP